MCLNSAVLSKFSNKSHRVQNLETDGIQEVSGSIPLISTTKKRGQKSSFFALLRSKDEPQTSCSIIDPPLADGRRERRTGQRFDPAC